MEKPEYYFKTDQFYINKIHYDFQNAIVNQFEDFHKELLKMEEIYKNK